MVITGIKFNTLKKNWPSSLVARSEIHKFTGGVIKPKTMSNLDSTGNGPKMRVIIGGRVAYPIDSLLEWLESRSRQIVKEDGHE